MVRRGLSELLGFESDLVVIDEAGSKEEAINAIQNGGCFDAVLLDLTLKNVIELDLIRRIRSLCPSMPILIVSMHDEVSYAPRCIDNGANGYVMKQEPEDVLIEAVRTVLRGEEYLSDKARRGLEKARQGLSGQKLTVAEEEVLQMIAEGKSSAQIAEVKCRSIKTIETHRSNIRIKLNLKDGADLIRYAAISFNPQDPEIKSE